MFSTIDQFNSLSENKVRYNTSTLRHSMQISQRRLGRCTDRLWRIVMLLYSIPVPTTHCVRLSVVLDHFWG